MAIKSIQTGDNWNAKPGTSNQTGNRAPRFPWSHSPVGRTARIVALCCAYKLDYTDERMAKLHQFPPAESISKVFVRLMPWFPPFYEETRLIAAGVKGYTGPLEPFNCGDVENRVRYCFAKPGRKGHDPKARLYGISIEHPSSTSQRKSGGRGEVFARCSVEVMKRIEMGQTISKAEAEEWGR